MTLKYQNIVLTISNMQPGQVARIEVSPNTSGTNIAWSSGEPFQVAGGIQIATQGGALPVSQFTVNPSTVTVITSSSAGSDVLRFTMQLCLVADDTLEYFYLRANMDPNVVVTAQIGAIPPQVVSTAAGLFSWNPQ